MFEWKFPLLTLGAARRPGRWRSKGVRSRHLVGGYSGRSPTCSPGPFTQVGGKAGRLIGLRRACPPRPWPAGARPWQRLPPPPPDTQTIWRKENDAVTSGRVRKRESIPVHPDESANLASMVGLADPNLSPRCRGGHSMSIPSTAINTCATPRRPPRPPILVRGDVRVPACALYCGHPHPHIPVTSPCFTPQSPPVTGKRIGDVS